MTTDEYGYRALAAGASGFLLKSLPPEELIAAVRIAAWPRSPSSARSPWAGGGGCGRAR